MRSMKYIVAFLILLLVIPAYGVDYAFGPVSADSTPDSYADQDSNLSGYFFSGYTYNSGGFPRQIDIQFTSEIDMHPYNGAGIAFGTITDTIGTDIVSTSYICLYRTIGEYVQIYWPGDELREQEPLVLVFVWTGGTLVHVQPNALVLVKE